MYTLTGRNKRLPEETKYYQPDDDVTGESTRPHLEVDIAGEGSKNVHPSLERILVH